MHSGILASAAQINRPVVASKMSMTRIAAMLPAAVGRTAGVSGLSSRFLGGSLQATQSRSVFTSMVVNAERLEGNVKWFDPVKGFGFILPKDGTQDLFVHQTSIVSNGFRSLADGEDVEYEIGEDPNGRTRAVNVTGPDGVPVKGSPRPASPAPSRNQYRDSY